MKHIKISFPTEWDGCKTGDVGSRDSLLALQCLNWVFPETGEKNIFWHFLSQKKKTFYGFV